MFFEMSVPKESAEWTSSWAIYGPQKNARRISPRTFPIMAEILAKTC
jgi:hypothetical protein